MESRVIPADYAGYNYIDTQRDLLVDALAQIDGDTCYLCNCEFVNEQDHKRSRTVDHYHSQDYCRKMGYTFEETHGMSNLRLSCKGCNSNKSNREWLDDGTLAPRGRVRAVKAPRPEICDTCMSGRLLLMGEECPDCGSGPQPVSRPRSYQRTPKECSHTGLEHCWMCHLSLVPRGDTMVSQEVG